MRPIYSHRSPLRTELNNLVRGACGGFLFGIPLIYTMEVWWIGSKVAPASLLISLILTTIIIAGLNYIAGFRQSTQTTFCSLVMDAIEAQAIGIICALILLIVLQEVTVKSHLSATLGKVTLESIPFAIGVSLSNQLLQDNPSQDFLADASTSNSRKKGPVTQRSRRNLWQMTLNDIIATGIGALIIGFNIAPTEEVTMIAARTSSSWLIITILISLVISYGIVFEASFSNQAKRRQQQGYFQDPFSETLMSYIVSLVISSIMLGFFQVLTLGDPLTLWLQCTIVLGLPATIGGAAGRLAL